MLMDTVICLLLVAAVLMVRQWLWMPMRVKGSSMLSTLHSGEVMLVSRLKPTRLGIQRGDVVICHFPGRYWKTGKWKLLKQHFVKRVIGLPGETIEIAEGVVLINGQPLEESYLDSTHNLRGASMPEKTLGPDEYFVMGDNRDNSNDSRRVGAIGRKDIVGCVTRVVWPFSAHRRIE